MPERLQEGPDLGARLTRCLVALFHEAGAGMAIGTDAPTLPTAILRAAKHALAVRRRRTRPFLRRGLLPGRPPHRARRSVRRREVVPPDTPSRIPPSARAGWARSVFVLPPWYDVDTAASLRLLRTHLLVEPNAAPETACVLRTVPTPHGRDVADRRESAE